MMACLKSSGVIQDTHKLGEVIVICDKSHKRREKICGQVQGGHLY